MKIRPPFESRTQHLTPLGLAIALGLAGPKLALADFVYWTGIDGGGIGVPWIWNDPRNWLYDVVPANGDNLYFTGTTGLTNIDTYS